MFCSTSKDSKMFCSTSKDSKIDSLPVSIKPAAISNMVKSDTACLNISRK